MERLDLDAFTGVMTTTQTLTTLPILTRWLAVTTGVGSLVTGGTLFAFSTFVMPGIRRLPASSAVSAMQAVNIEAPRSLLMLPLLGSAAGGAVLAVLALTRPGTGQRGLVLAGAVAAAATVAITAIYHVPHNNALARLQPDGASTARAWGEYYRGWVAWNHVRTVTAIGGGVALLLAVTRQPR